MSARPAAALRAVFNTATIRVDRTPPTTAIASAPDGFTNADGWPLLINFPINKDNSPYDIPIELPREQTIPEFPWIRNMNYWPTTKVNLIFDNDRAAVASYAVEPTGEAQVLPVNPPPKYSQWRLIGDCIAA